MSTFFTINSLKSWKITANNYEHPVKSCGFRQTEFRVMSQSNWLPIISDDLQKKNYWNFRFYGPKSENTSKKFIDLSFEYDDARVTHRVIKTDDRLPEHKASVCRRLLYITYTYGRVRNIFLNGRHDTREQLWKQRKIDFKQCNRNRARIDDSGTPKVLESDWRPQRVRLDDRPRVL